MRVTICYDNTTRRDDCGPDWGFGCLVEAHGKRLLFDTGTKGGLLLANLAALEVDPASIDGVVISHRHYDHLGGLPELVEAAGALPVHLPQGCPQPPCAAEFNWNTGPVELHPGLHSTGTIKGLEQALVVELERGCAVIVGCSHPGPDAFLRSARRIAEPRALIGGLHGFRKVGRLEHLELICPTHCTVFKGRIARFYPGAYVEGGVGTVIELD